jgi:hypothetical protein
LAYSYNGYKMTDGDTGTWQATDATSLPVHFYCILPVPEPVSAVRLARRAGESAAVRAWTLYGSDDGETWTSVASGETTDTDGLQEFTFTEATYRAWRLTATTAWGTYIYLSEWELLADDASTRFDLAQPMTKWTTEDLAITGNAQYYDEITDAVFNLGANPIDGRITWDFGTPVQVDALRSWASPYAMTQESQSYRAVILSWSDNGSAWTEVVTEAAHGAFNGPFIYPTEEATPHQYWRMDITEAWWAAAWIRGAEVDLVYFGSSLPGEVPFATVPQMNVIT